MTQLVDEWVQMFVQLPRDHAYVVKCDSRVLVEIAMQDMMRRLTAMKLKYSRRGTSLYNVVDGRILFVSLANKDWEREVRGLRLMNQQEVM